MKIQLIITAAGLSRRNPPNKLLAKINGERVINLTISKFIEEDLDIIIVTGHQHSKIEEALSKRFANKVKMVINPDYRSGIASSIKAGINAANDRSDYFMFCNGDKPFIERNTIQKLFSVLEKKPDILIPTYGNIPGHPTFFHVDLKSELLLIQGDSGAKQILNVGNKEVLYVPVDDEGVITDMDRYFSDGRNE